MLKFQIIQLKCLHVKQSRTYRHTFHVCFGSSIWLEFFIFSFIRSWIIVPCGLRSRNLNMPQSGHFPAAENMECLAKMLRDSNFTYAPKRYPTTVHAPIDGDSARRISKKKKNSSKQASRLPECESIPKTTVVACAVAPEGGKIVSSRDERGLIHMRIEYDRSQVLMCAQSPYALLPPESIRTIIMDMPEILASFPFRHGVPRKKQAIHEEETEGAFENGP